MHVAYNILQQRIDFILLRARLNVAPMNCDTMSECFHGFLNDFVDVCSVGTFNWLVTG